MTHSYTYDANGNILTVSDGTNTTSYVYDSQNQLVRENNQAANKTWVWTYDNAGNIESRKEYAYTTADTLGDPVKTVNYTYGDTAWGDLLTAYDGVAITYDEIGNPLTDGEWTYTWEHGRQLASMTKGVGTENEVTISYTYNADGMRTGKTVTTRTYVNNHTHTYFHAVVDPTCQEMGYTQHTCSCGSSYKDSYTPKVDHVYIRDRLTNTYVCKWCGIPLPGIGPIYPIDPPGGGEIMSLGDNIVVPGTPELTLVSTVVEQYDYVYNGSSLTQMVVTTTTTADEEITTSTDTLFFAYDASGSPLAVTYNGVDYYYTANIQGDIVGVVDSTGTQVVSYSYDAWGNALSVTGTMAETLGSVNPLRYRGYVYDTDTGLFYLQSRYYSPEIGRFINADGLVSTGQGLLGNNMFAYCRNNPTNAIDPAGHFDYTIRTPDAIIRKAIYRFYKIVSDNYKNNSKMDSDPETSTANKLINDQNGKTGQNFTYGHFPVSYNGCEAIAIHNALVLLGKESTLSNTLQACQLSGAMLLEGAFGTNPYKIGNVLDTYGVAYSNVALSDMTQAGVYIISFWNSGAPWHGLHTVAVYYDGTQYTTYNLRGNGTIDHRNPSSYAGDYICGYYLGG